MSEVFVTSERCRCCLSHSSIMTSVFETIQEFSTQIRDLVSTAVGVWVLENDHYPKSICESCLSDLTIAVRFRQRCLKSEDILKKTKKPNFQFMISIPTEQVPTVDKLSTAQIKKETPVIDPNVNQPPQESSEPQQDRLNFQCDICNKDFQQQYDLTYHMRTHASDRPFRCDICGNRFIRCSELTHHRRSHLNERPRKCEICGKEFRKTSHLTQHMRTHTGERMFKCDICGRDFLRNTHLVEHRRLHTGERPHKCEICGQEFSRSTDYTHHKRVHAGERPYKCDLCGDEFFRCSSLTYHLRKKHKRDPVKKALAASANAEVTDITTGAVKLEDGDRDEEPVPVSVSFLVRMNTVIKIEVYDDSDGESKPSIHIIDIEPTKLADWEQKSTNERNVETDLRSHITGFETTYEKVNDHLEVSVPPGHNVPPEDTQCGKTYDNTYDKSFEISETFNNKKRQEVNQKIDDGHEHEKRRPPKRKCKKCGKYVANLMQHLLIHTGSKPYQCNNCNKRFNLKQNLYRHQLTHTGVLAFNCDTCGEAFKSSTLLKYHSRIHTGDLLKCTICDKDFIIPAELKRHVATHQEGMLECDICLRKYAGKVGIRKHKRRTHGIKADKGSSSTGAPAEDEYDLIMPGKERFHCDKCGKVFRSKGRLLQHCETHLAERRGSKQPKKCTKETEQNLIGRRRYTCDKCNESFTFVASLKRHQRHSPNGDCLVKGNLE
ncbi:zinc finger protein 502-like [Wyeomyia smithii]|uniref:zinc finger protein 502-like n=1 Tax=Wyeomyia smithii TaxID=174621 RepID=UPI0024681337|nr:zinc finger protein 502-like [Wyeomyia smithii]